MIIDRLFYYAGSLTVDAVVYVAIYSNGVKIGKKVMDLGSKFALKDKSSEAICENLFECLEDIQF